MYSAISLAYTERISVGDGKSQGNFTVEGGRKVQILICVGCSVVASIITTKMMANYYFGLVDSYVSEICNKTKDFVQKAESTICKQ